MPLFVSKALASLKLARFWWFYGIFRWF